MAASDEGLTLGGKAVKHAFKRTFGMIANGFVNVINFPRKVVCEIKNLKKKRGQYKCKKFFERPYTYKKPQANEVTPGNWIAQSYPTPMAIDRRARFEKPKYKAGGKTLRGSG